MMKDFEADHMPDELEMPNPFDGEDDIAGHHDDKSPEVAELSFPDPLRFSVD